MNGNLYKKIFIIIIIISVIFSFIPYTKTVVTLDDQAYVMAIGVDIGTTSKYKISFQISTLSSSATESSTESSGNDTSSDSPNDNKTPSNYIINTIDADSIDSAIIITNSYLNRSINLSHCKILVISEDLAKKGINNIINSLIDKVEIRPDCNIIVSKITETEFNESDKPTIEELLYKYYETTSNIETGRHGYSELVKLTGFYLNLNDSFSQPYCTLGIVSKSSFNSIEKENRKSTDLSSQSRSLTTLPKEDVKVENIGLAVFKNDTLVGTLSPEETLCHELLINNLNYSILSIPSPFDFNEVIDLQLYTFKKPNVKIKTSNSYNDIDVDIYVIAKLLSFSSRSYNVLTEDNLNNIKNTASDYLEKHFESYFNKTSKELNSDIGGLGKFAAKHYMTIQKWEEYNWLENYKNSNFNISVDISLKAGHLLTNE